MTQAACLLHPTGAYHPTSLPSLPCLPLPSPHTAPLSPRSPPLCPHGNQAKRPSFPASASPRRPPPGALVAAGGGFSAPRRCGARGSTLPPSPLSTWPGTRLPGRCPPFSPPLSASSPPPPPPPPSSARRPPCPCRPSSPPPPPRPLRPPPLLWPPRRYALCTPRGRRVKGVGKGTGRRPGGGKSADAAVAAT